MNVPHPLPLTLNNTLKRLVAQDHITHQQLPNNITYTNRYLLLDKIVNPLRKVQLNV